METDTESRGLKTGRTAVPKESFHKAGTVVFREGEGSREVYLVLDGRLLVTCQKDGLPHPVAEIGAKSVFGEMSLLDNRPRSATVTAIDDSRLVAIPPATFIAVLRDVPPWFRSVLKIVVRRLREANANVRRHSVADSLVSFCRFLTVRIDGEAFSTPWIPLVDEFHLVSRLPRDEIRRCAQVLIGKGIARIDSEQRFVVPDATRLVLFTTNYGLDDPAEAKLP